MESGLRSRVIRAIAVAIGVLGLVAPASVHAAQPAGLDLIVHDPLPGYPIYEGPGSKNGNVDVPAMAAGFGVSSDQLPTGLIGEARTWGSAAHLAQVMVIGSSSVEFTSEILDGALGTDRSNDFDTGIAGTVGQTSVTGGVTAYVILWRQGTFYVQVVTAGSSPVTSAANARAVAAKEIALLLPAAGAPVAAPTLPGAVPVSPEVASGPATTVAGFDPAALPVITIALTVPPTTVPATNHPDTGKSPASIAGAIIGGLLGVILLVLICKGLCTMMKPKGKHAPQFVGTQIVRPLPTVEPVSEPRGRASASG